MYVSKDLQRVVGDDISGRYILVGIAVPSIANKFLYIAAPLNACC
jgi:hypothetical protein